MELPFGHGYATGPDWNCDFDPCLFSYQNLKSRLAFLDKIFSLTSTDNA